MSTNPWWIPWCPPKWNLNIWRFPGLPRVQHFPGPKMPVKAMERTPWKPTSLCTFWKEPNLEEKPFIGFQGFFGCWKTMVGCWIQGQLILTLWCPKVVTYLFSQCYENRYWHQRWFCLEFFAENPKDFFKTKLSYAATVPKKRPYKLSMKYWLF